MKEFQHYKTRMIFPSFHLAQGNSSHSGLESNPPVNCAIVNLLTPNDPYMGRTAPLTSKRCILYIYSTNVGTEYFKHALYSTSFLFKMQFVS